MKKFGFFAVALAAAAISFTSCDEKGQNNGGGVDLNALPNGFYVSEQGADLVAANAMDQGINEVDQSARAGMYETQITLARLWSMAIALLLLTITKLQATKVALLQTRL